MVRVRVIVLGSINLKLIGTWYTYLEWALLSVGYSEFSCVFCVLCCCCDTNLLRRVLNVIVLVLVHCSCIVLVHVLYGAVRGTCIVFVHCSGIVLP